MAAKKVVQTGFKTGEASTKQETAFNSFLHRATYSLISLLLDTVEIVQNPIEMSIGSASVPANNDFRDVLRSVVKYQQSA